VAGKRSRRIAARLVLVGSLLVAAGCGSQGPAASSPPAQVPTQTAPAANAAPPASPKPLQPVTLRLDFLVQGYHAPFVLAKEKGFYRDAGLDVSVAEGKAGATTLQTVANGNDTFGLSDALSLALSVSKGLPVKMLAIYIQQTPLGFVVHQAMPFRSPADLKGKTVIETTDLGTRLTEYALSLQGLSPKDVNQELVQPSAATAAFLQDPRAVLVCFAAGNCLGPKKEEPTARILPFADYGVHMLATGLLTSLNQLQTRPDVVRAFLEATTKGWQYAKDHRDEAVQAVLAEFPKADPALIRQSLDATLDRMLHTQASQGHLVGWMADADWQQTLKLAHDYFQLPNDKPSSDYYTNEYLPQGSS